MRLALARLAPAPFTRIIIMHLIGIQQGGNKERGERESENVGGREVGINRGFLLGCSLYRLRETMFTYCFFTDYNNRYLLYAISALSFHPSPHLCTLVGCAICFHMLMCSRSQRVAPH